MTTTLRLMDRIFDLPAHPLLVHFPVVAIPVLALASVAVAFVPSFRRRYSLLVAGLAAVTMISTFAASRSGEELSEILGAEEWIETHQNLGTQLTWMVVALTLGLGLIAGLDRRRPDLVTAQRAFGGVVAVLGVLSLVWAVRTGHEGAKAHWEPLVPAESEIETSAATTTTEAAVVTTTESETTTSIPETTTEAPTTTAAAETTTTVAPDDSTAKPPNGMRIYEDSCQRCHRPDGSGGRGPSLIGIAAEQTDPQTQVDQILAGGRGMPSFAERLSADEIDAVVAYIRDTFV